MTSVMFVALAAFNGMLISGLRAPEQDMSPQSPLVQLASDLETAMSRAHLSAAQKVQLQSDDDILRSNARRKANGAEVDRGQVVKAVKDLRSVARSGAFQAEDQRRIDADIEALRKR